MKKWTATEVQILKREYLTARVLGYQPLRTQINNTAKAVGRNRSSVVAKLYQLGLLPPGR